LISAADSLMLSGKDADFGMSVKRKVDLLTNDPENYKNVSLDLLEQVSQRMLKIEKQRSDSWPMSKYYLHEMLQGARFFFPPVPKPAERSAELNKRLEEIRNAQMNQQYYSMVRGAISPESEVESTRREWRATKSHLAAIVNVLLSSLSVGWVMFYLSTSLGVDDSVRVLLGLLTAIIVASAESFLYYLYAQRSEPRYTRMGSIGMVPLGAATI